MSLYVTSLSLTNYQTLRELFFFYVCVTRKCRLSVQDYPNILWSKIFDVLHPAGVFGMNLTHGLESQPAAFLITCGGITMVMAGLFAQGHRHIDVKTEGKRERESMLRSSCSCVVTCWHHCCDDSWTETERYVDSEKKREKTQKWISIYIYIYRK